MSILARLNRAEKIIAKMHGLSAPMATLAMVDGSSKGPVLWVDAMQLVLSGEAVSVECDNPDFQGLLNAMMPHTSP